MSTAPMDDGCVDLWLDGRHYRVEPPVVAQMRLLADLNAKMADLATIYAQALIRAGHALPTRRGAA